MNNIKSINGTLKYTIKQIIENRDINISWNSKSIIPKLIYRVSPPPIKIPDSYVFLWRRENRTNSKIYIELQRPIMTT